MAATKFHLMRVMVMLALLFISFVQAGHYKWEPAHSVAIANAKWIHMDPFRSSQRRWPDKTVRYCWQDDATRNALQNFLRDALQVWYSGGLSEDHQWVLRPHDECVGEKRDTSLVIHLVGGGTMGASVGITGTPPTPPAMFLSILEGPTPEQLIATYAHELGHVWGLYHEHQDPRLWDLQEGPLIFHCENLRDFEEKTRGLTERQIWGPHGICKDWDEAVIHGFVAQAYTPIPRDLAYSDRPWYSTDRDVDWKSIMLYRSEAFAVSQDRPVLMRRVGMQRVPFNMVPSQLDIQGIAHLYHGRNMKPDEMLPYYPGHTWYSTFRSHLPSCGRR